MIRTEGLTKRFGRVLAVDDVALVVGEGDRYGFLGPNGSGKTTTVRMLLGLVFATSGTIELMGRPVPRQARSALTDVGALIEAPAAYGHLSARTNLTVLDAAGPGGPRRTRRRRVEDALEQVGLSGVGRRPVKAFSLGMKQRLGLAAALMRSPRLLVLDEPTNGLDPQGIREVRDVLLELNRAGTTIFLSSHLLTEVESLCTRVGVLQQGRLVVQDELTALQSPTGRVHVRTPDPDLVVGLLDGRVEHRDGDLLVVRHPDPAALADLLVRQGARLHELRPERRSLEDVVLEMTGPGSDRVGTS
ncbi:MAG: ABC transporter ATP-binding protein [Spirochaetaceae bacterium]|nr:ABC transporter ATP-binding protein [Spirochaetaceae bacterium]